MDRSDARAVARLGQGSRVEIVSLVRGGAEETYGVEMYAFDRSWPECRFVIGERQLVQFTDQLAKQKRKIKRRRRINASTGSSTRREVKPS